MAKSEDDLAPLSEYQQEIMEIIWERGEISASEVRDLLSHKRDVAKNTIRTLMERMEDKGWLKHREVGRTHLYSAARTREATIGKKVLDVLDQVCGGSPEALMSALIDHRGLKPGELDRIQSLLQAAKDRHSNRKGSK